MSDPDLLFAKLTAAHVPGAQLRRVDFNRPTLQVARALLGKCIVRQVDGQDRVGLICEVEAYKGPRDRAAHTFGGRRTPRVLPLYGDGGTAYVYLIYGIHWLLNFSTAGRDQPEGVLVRGVIVVQPGPNVRLDGPGRVTRFLQIDKALDGVDATDSVELRIEDRGVAIPASWVRARTADWHRLRGRVLVGAAVALLDRQRRQATSKVVRSWPILMGCKRTLLRSRTEQRHPGALL